MAPKAGKFILIILASFGLFGLESIIKYSLINKIPPEGFYLVPKILQIIYSPNFNIAFSLPLPKVIILGLIVCALIFLSYIWWLNFIKQNFGLFLASSLLIIGAFSNFIDRLILGYVVDYINIFIWPVFNLADCLIVSGICIYIFFEVQPTKKALKN